MHVHTCICVMRVCILYVYISVCIYINVCWFLFKYACMLVYIFTCLRIYAGVHICLHVYIMECIHVRGYFCVRSCVWLRVAVFRIRLVRSGLLQEIRTRFRFVLVVDPIHRRFEDRSMRWSVDQCWFVQWRPDDISVPKLCHFMWVFDLMSFSYLRLLLDIDVFIRIISCDFILYFTSLTCCITSGDISDCSPYLCNWCKFVSVSFHVLVNRYMDIYE